MAFARPKPDANGEFVRQQYTELSDVIRARNKREDRLLNVRLKFYEREKNIRLSFIHREKYQLERVRTSLFEDANRMELKKQNFPMPLWLPPRPKSQRKVLQLSTPEFSVTHWKFNSNLIQTERFSSKPTKNRLTATNILRSQSAR